MILTAHRALLIDAVATAATAVAMFAARGLLFSYFGLGSSLLLDVTAAGFLVYAAVLVLVAARPVISRTALLTIASANVIYVLASMIALSMFWSELHAVGRGLIVAVALAVEGFAMLQVMAARRVGAVAAV